MSWTKTQKALCILFGFIGYASFTELAAQPVAIAQASEGAEAWVKPVGLAWTTLGRVPLQKGDSVRVTLGQVQILYVNGSEQVAEMGAAIAISEPTPASTTWEDRVRRGWQSLLSSWTTVFTGREAEVTDATPSNGMAQAAQDLMVQLQSAEGSAVRLLQTTAVHFPGYHVQQLDVYATPSASVCSAQEETAVQSYRPQGVANLLQVELVPEQSYRLDVSTDDPAVTVTLCGTVVASAEQERLETELSRLRWWVADQHSPCVQYAMGATLLVELGYPLAAFREVARPCVLDDAEGEANTHLRRAIYAYTP